jgi:hypothetical protein
MVVEQYGGTGSFDLHNWRSLQVNAGRTGLTRWPSLKDRQFMVPTRLRVIDAIQRGLLRQYTRKTWHVSARPLGLYDHTVMACELYVANDLDQGNNMDHPMPTIHLQPPLEFDELEPDGQRVEAYLDDTVQDL